MDEFTTKVPSIHWNNQEIVATNYAGLEAHLARYQNPQEADSMMKMMQELDETKIILVNDATQLLQLILRSNKSKFQI